MKQRCLGCMAEYETEYGICPYCGYEPDTPADNPLHLRPGTRLADRYTVGRVLGYGGFGVTYIAFDSVLDQRVAIKEYLPSEFATRMAGDSQVSVFGGNKAEQFADGLLKFVDEAKRLAKFQGEEGIVRVFDSFEDNRTAYIVMEYLEGETLTAYLEREGILPPEKAAAWLEPVVRSLEVVHQAGIIHRDIAPDNIFLTADGRVKLIDFGAARYATTSHSRSLTVIIKPGYSPEEQYRSRGDQGPHTDVYALAAVFYRMITGAAPADALERRAVLENKGKDILLPPSKYCKIDDSLENAVLNAMNVRIEDRTATVRDFWTELTSEEPVKRRGNRIKALDLARWPLGLKFGVPALGLGALALLVLLLTGTIGPKAVPVGNMELGEGMTRVPGVINYSIGAAQEMLDQQQLTPVIGGRQQSDVIPPDLVLTQSVDAGQVVAVDTQVELYISEQPNSQPEDGCAPDALYHTEAEAVELFRKQGIEPTLEYSYSSDVAEGLVVWQSVAAGDSLAEDTEVVLTISSGPEPEPSQGPGASQEPEAARPLRLNRTSLSLYVGDTVTLSASGGSGNYRWSSDDAGVAAVQNGVVTAAGPGRAVITVSSGTETASCPVSVREYSLTMSQSSLTMTKGTATTLSVSGVPSGTAVSWSSSNRSVATVRDGQVTAAGAGNAVITAQMTYGGRSYSCTCAVTVTGAAEPEGSIKLSPSSVSLVAGEERSLSVVTVPSNQIYLMEVSDESVAQLTDSGVAAVGPGTAIITVQMVYNGKNYQDSCRVTVSAPAAPAAPTTVVTVTPEPTPAPTIPTTVVTVTSEPTPAPTPEPPKVTVTSAPIIIEDPVYIGPTPAPTSTSAPITTMGWLRVNLSSTSLTLGYNESSFVSATMDSSTLILGASPTYTWSSSDPSVATVRAVDSSGKMAVIEAAGAGTATITVQVSYHGRTAQNTCQVTVTP